MLRCSVYAYVTSAEGALFNLLPSILYILYTEAMYNGCSLMLGFCQYTSHNLDYIVSDLVLIRLHH